MQQQDSTASTNQQLESIPSTVHSPTGLKHREFTQRDMQVSTFSLSREMDELEPRSYTHAKSPHGEFSIENMQLEEIAGSGRDTPTRRRRRDSGQHDMQSSTFSVSQPW
ncbi:uncharacterized protein LOC114365240 [Ostrinia furnacalis]|uniref:uncharacterized protein LOC114365240 n=1 Tax=Ostrinia furnacalis TaxID=93504 RepID=UPI00103D69BB|nr:uncharacterized protein LOC114365240 [Ostrinia furnacalis]